MAIERFAFATAGRIIFGPGVLTEIGGLVREFGSSAFIITGRSAQRENLLSALDTAGVSHPIFEIQGEPTLESCTLAVEQARKSGSDVIIGFGGGSAIDLAKATAAMLTNPGELLDYLEVIGQGKVIKYPSVPVIAIPTTAGPGAEVTRNAVLLSPEHGVKVSLRSYTMLPAVALIDPELCLSLPPAQTAATGMDALTQLIEPFVSTRANSMTDIFCRDGLRLAARSLGKAFSSGDDLSARVDMSMASLLGGLALANAGLGAVHGFAAPVGGMFRAPHGAVCAALLAPVVEVNVAALKQRSEDSSALLRYTEIVRILTGRENASVKDGIDWLANLTTTLNIPGLASYGIRKEVITDLIEKASQSSSMKGNPIGLTYAEMAEILQKAL